MSRNLWRARRAQPPVPLLLCFCLILGPRSLTAAPPSIHPSLQSIHPGEAMSERFLQRDANGGVLVDLFIEGDVSPELLRGHGVHVNTHVGRYMTVRCPLPLLTELLGIPGIERVRVSERCKPNL